MENVLLCHTMMKGGVCVKVKKLGTSVIWGSGFYESVEFVKKKQDSRNDRRWRLLAVYQCCNGTFWEGGERTGKRTVQRKRENREKKA